MTTDEKPAKHGIRWCDRYTVLTEPLSAVPVLGRAKHFNTHPYHYLRQRIRGKLIESKGIQFYSCAEETSGCWLALTFALHAWANAGGLMCTIHVNRPFDELTPGLTFEVLQSLSLLLMRLHEMLTYSLLPTITKKGC